MRAKYFLKPVFLAFALALMAAGAAWAQPVTVLVPSQPSVEMPPSQKGKKASAQGAAEIEVDVLISLMLPFENQGVDMDMPRLFAALRYPQAEKGMESQPLREDLLGDVEEIRYLNAKAWGANVALKEAGLYQFILEARPWWDAAKNMFSQQQAKVVLPALGVENGWDMPAGMNFEIMPLTRPFGLTSPAFFSGKVLFQGKPLANAPVYMGRINADKSGAPTNWHKILKAKTDSDGQFGFILNQPGWWYCEATMKSDPLKGPDGEPKDMERSTILWLYVDPQPPRKS